MKAAFHARRMTLLAAAAMTSFGWVGVSFGQSFSSGSTGADGPYAPTCAPTPCTVTETLNASGVYNYSTVTIPAGVTVRWTRNVANTPVSIFATGDVTITGTLSLVGANGIPALGSGSAVNPGGLGGPGGYNGGNSAVTGGVLATAGQGPGGGAPGTGSGFPNGGSYGAVSTFVSLLPLFGGSGGGGSHIAGSQGITAAVGASGGGGGGALLIASSTNIVLNGSILANGGNGTAGSVEIKGNGGSGGAIRLVASQITGTGTIQANAGTNVGGVAPGPGRVRLEALSQQFAGSISPAASQSISPGPVNAASTPALIALPTISVASIAGTSAPATPAGLFTSADVSLPGGTTNPVSVVVATTNTPVGASTAITLRLIPQSGNFTAIAIPTASQTGTFATSTATTSVTLPVGQVSVLQAFASMTLTGQIASLFPLIEGEPVRSVAMASPLEDGKPVLNLVTASGIERRYDQLNAADQMRVAMAWQALSAGH